VALAAASVGLPWKILAAGDWIPAPLKSIKALDSRTVQETFDGIYGAYIAYGTPSPVWPKAYLAKKYGTSSASAVTALW